MHNTYKHPIRVIPHSVVHFSPAIFDNTSLDLKNAYFFSPTHPLPFSVWYSHLAALLSPAGIPSAQALWRRDFQLPAQLQSTSQSCSSHRLTNLEVTWFPFFAAKCNAAAGTSAPPHNRKHWLFGTYTFLTSYSCKPLLLHFSSNLKHSDILSTNCCCFAICMTRQYFTVPHKIWSELLRTAQNCSEPVRIHLF